MSSERPIKSKFFPRVGTVMAVALTLAVGSLAFASPASAGDDDHRWHRGKHHGHHHKHYRPQVVYRYAPPPVYYAPPPRVVYVEPRPAYYYAPPPVVYAPPPPTISLGFVFGR